MTSCATWCRENGVKVGDHVMFRPKAKQVWRRALVTNLNAGAVTLKCGFSTFCLTGSTKCLQLEASA